MLNMNSKGKNFIVRRQNEATTGARRLNLIELENHRD